MLESLKGFATSNFGWIVDKYPEFFSVVKDNLPKADMKISYRTYVSVVILFSLLIFILSFIASFITLSIIQIHFLMKIFYSLFSSFFVAITTFIIFIFYPSQKAERRKQRTVVEGETVE